MPRLPLLGQHRLLALQTSNTRYPGKAVLPDKVKGPRADNGRQSGSNGTHVRPRGCLTAKEALPRPKPPTSLPGSQQTSHVRGPATPPPQRACPVAAEGERNPPSHGSNPQGSPESPPAVTRTWCRGHPQWGPGGWQTLLLLRLHRCLPDCCSVSMEIVSRIPAGCGANTVARAPPCGLRRSTVSIAAAAPEPATNAGFVHMHAQTAPTSRFALPL